MKFNVTTFGCQMNAADSTWLTRALQGLGWQEVCPDEASVFLVNTCSVRDKPEQKLYSHLGRLSQHLLRDESVFCAVGGCVAQQVGTKLWDRFPFVRLVFGTDGVGQTPQALVRLAREPRLRLSLLDFTETYVERDPAWPAGSTPPLAFVNIMQGCDNFCAYCIVPYTRGRQKSRTPGAVLEECHRLVDLGAKEITLLGQNVNSYGQDLGQGAGGFSSLLRQVAAIPGLRRLRFTTSHPKDLAPEVIAAYGELPNLCGGLHLPVQSGSDAVLARMGRKYTARDYLAKVQALRKARPDICLTTDIIVGFPGETEADFRATLDLVRQAGFESSFCFMYGERPGVAAAKMEPKVPQEIKSWRFAELLALQNSQQESMLRLLTGKTSAVLVEGPGQSRNGEVQVWRAKDDGGRVVNFAGSPARDLTGEMLDVLITAAKRHSLWGEVAI